jgi:hypothetical protein
MKTAEGRALFLFFCLLTVLTNAVGEEAELKDDPIYNGKALSAWIDELPSPLSRVTHTNRPDVQAIRAIGTNAIPWLLRQLTASPWTPVETNSAASYIHQNRTRLGFWALGEIGTPAIPSLVNLIEQQPDAVPSALAGIGAPALPAIEGCLTNVTDDLSLDSPKARSVASALGGLVVAIDAGRISTNRAEYLLPAIRFWTRSTNHIVAFWARGLSEKLSPESRSHD